MPVEVIMPKVDMDMATGKLAVWHVAEGETVKKGAALFDIETDKAAMEVEAPATGRLHHILAAPGETVAVGKPVAFIYAEGEAVGTSPVAVEEPKVEAPAPAPVAAPVAVAAPAPAPAAVPDSADLRATPVARRLAREAGLALAAIAGTGPRGRIQRADVEAAVVRAKPALVAEAPVAPVATPAAPITWEPQPGDLNVTTRKGSGVPLVMIHGFAADSYGWRPLEDALPKDQALIRIDLPSHGRSPLKRVGGFAELAKLMVQVFDRVAEGPVHVLGHSLGGGLALALADIRPRQVRTLSLIAPAGLGPEIDGAALNGIARAASVDSLAPWLKRLTARPEGISHDFAKAAMLARLDPGLREAQQELGAVLFPDGVQAFDLTAALGRIAMPTLMIWGRDDHILPWRQALAAPGEVALHLLRGVGHVPQMEDPATVAALLGRHLRG